MHDLPANMNESVSGDRTKWVNFDINEPSESTETSSTFVKDPSDGSVLADRLTPVDLGSEHPLADTPNAESPDHLTVNQNYKQRPTIECASPQTSCTAATITPSQSNTFNQSAALTTPSPLPSARLSRNLQLSSDSVTPSVSGSVSIKETLNAASSRPASTMSMTHSPFQNGDLIVNLMPLNQHCSWVIPALFKPEYIPEQLMISGLRLTVEDYVSAMQTLLNDYRFNMYILFYKRILFLLTLIGFVFLLILLFSGVKGPSLLMGVFFWLMLNSFGLFITIWLKFRMTRNLEQCIATVNEQLIRNNLMMAVDDRGKISCHKIVIPFVYFDITYCVKYLNDIIENEERARDPAVAINSTIRSLSALEAGNRNSVYRPDHMQPPACLVKSDLQVSDIFITGANPTRVSQRQRYGEKLLLRYSQRYIRQLSRNELGLNTCLHPDGSINPRVQLSPRHCATARCPCQYIEEHLKFKPLNKPRFRDIFM